MIIFEEKKSIFDEKYVFLDLDGVLTGYPHPISKENFDKDKRHIQLMKVETDVVKGGVSTAIRKDLAENLSKILHKTKARLVLSTSWRTHPDRSWMKKLEHLLDYYVYDITPLFNESGITDSDTRYTNCPRVYCRAHQIDLYIKKHKCKNYVILDDLPLHEYKGKYPDVFKHFICTNNDNIPGNYGLTKFKMERAIEVLEGRRPNIKYLTLPIDFPKEEISKVRKQSNIGTCFYKNQPIKFDIVTTRVDKDYYLYYDLDMVKTPWNECYTVFQRLELNDVEDHPFYKHLTKDQIKTISKYDKFAVIFLKKSGNE